MREALPTCLALLLAACSDSAPPKTERWQPVPDFYNYRHDVAALDGPADLAAALDQVRDGKPIKDLAPDKRDGAQPPDAKKPPADAKPPVDTKAPDLNCTPAGYEGCTSPPSSCCGGLACCSCSCAKVCQWNQSISCPNVCLNYCP